jgi:hypothetical protein
MGIVHVHRGRLTPALILTVFAVLAAVIVGLTAGQAAAVTGYQHGGAVCGTCHTSVPYTSANVSNAQCQTCHTGYTKAHTTGGVASTCWTCHAPGQNMATIKTNAKIGGCGATAAGAGCHASPGHVGSAPTTCVNCHGVTATTTNSGQSAHHNTSVTDVQVKALLTIKVPASVKVKKTIKATGLAKSDQAGYVVTVLVQQKVGTKWVKKASMAAVWVQATSSWTFSYKPTKKGTWRMQASTPAVAGTNGNATAITAGKTAYKTFKVK